MAERSGVATASGRVAPLLFFATVAGGVYAVAFHLSAILPSLARAEAIAAGVTLDLALVVPAVWYVLVIRRLGWSWLTLVPFVAAGMVTASRILPAAHHSTLGVLGLVAVPLELGLLGYLGWRAVTALRRAGAESAGEDDPFSAIRVCARELVPNAWLAGVLADEISVLYGGLVSWWLPPAGPRNGCFTLHRRDAYASVIAGLLLVLAIELFPVHVLLARWSPLAAWCVSGLSLYGAVWMIADLQAMRLRPIRLTADGLELRVGLRWDVSIPLDGVACIERVAPGTPRRAKGVLNMVPLGEATHRLTLREPVTVRAPYGLRRVARVIAFGVDEPERFDRELVRLGVTDPGVPASTPGGREGGPGR